MTTWTTIHLPTILHFHLGSLATNQHLNMKLLTLSKGWWLFESTSTQGLICHIKEWPRVSWADSTGKGTRLNGRRKYMLNVISGKPLRGSNMTQSVNQPTLMWPSLYFQNLKNQIMTTNLWVEQVRLNYSIISASIFDVTPFTLFKY